MPQDCAELKSRTRLGEAGWKAGFRGATRNSLVGMALGLVTHPSAHRSPAQLGWTASLAGLCRKARSNQGLATSSVQTFDPTGEGSVREWML